MCTKIQSMHLLIMIDLYYYFNHFPSFLRGNTLWCNWYFETYIHIYTQNRDNIHRRFYTKVSECIRNVPYQVPMDPDPVMGSNLTSSISSMHRVNVPLMHLFDGSVRLIKATQLIVKLVGWHCQWSSVSETQIIMFTLSQQLVVYKILTVHCPCSQANIISLILQLYSIPSFDHNLLPLTCSTREIFGQF